MARATMYFPPDFLWGTATAAHQVEGTNLNNDWWDWEQEDGHIEAGHKSGLACNWWENALPDLDQAADMGTNSHRLSVEWSRIEPEPSVFVDDVLVRYREILQAMHDRGIEPMVTLHHFTNPRWLVEKGDFGADVVVDYFQRYTAKVVDTLGDLVSRWVTFNEPLVYVTLRYFRDVFPAPAKRGWSEGMRALRNMLRCHAAAYHAIKEAAPGAAVGVAKHIRPLERPPQGSRLDGWWARRAAWFFNQQWMDSLVTGRLRWPLGRGTVAHLANSYDFVGINYYTRSYVTFPRRPSQMASVANPDPGNDGGGSGFEPYPPGLFRAIKDQLHHRKPIFITENGLPDSTDARRPAFILTHLREVWRAISFNYPVMGYFHWSLVDNFEFHHGWTRRYGLIEVDPETQARRPRTSARLYGEICRSNSISSEMVERYASEVLETMFPGSSPVAASDDQQIPES